MTNKFSDLIDQTYYFPQEGFDIEDGYLTFHGIPLIYLINKYGTPLKLTYLPKIGAQIKRARNLFNRTIKSSGYRGKYHYCYCTKASHFSHILNEVLKYNVQLETSSSFDIDLIWKLYQKGKVRKEKIIIHNGFKTDEYVSKIASLVQEGFKNSIPVLDNKEEFELYKKHFTNGCKIGIRVATEEEPNFSFYTSRLGIRYADIIPFCKKNLRNNKQFTLKMLHFFVDTGIKDSLYYWGELKKAVRLYCQLKKEIPELKAINIGGGLPIRNSLEFEYDYKKMIKEIVFLIQQECEAEGVPEPDLFTEFGKYTIGESGATIFSVLAQKKQNDRELWYMIDNSLMSTVPDIWGISERFIMLPINKWNNEYTQVNLGGLTCDNSDYYNAEVHGSQLFLPKIKPDSKESLYVGFFHTGAYQDALSGYGGIKHCLIPSPKHILIAKDAQGNLKDTLYKPEQDAKTMMDILGY